MPDITPFPKAFLSQMQALLEDEFEAFTTAMATPPIVSYRRNPKKHIPRALPQSNPVPWNPEAFYLSERPAFFKDPLFYAGAYYVQEASSMLITQFIPQDKPIKVLDLCAAPGGKSTLLLSLLPEGSLLVSNEMVHKRAIVLEENISRWGYHNVIITQNRPSDFRPLRHFFDLILVDAPCSGEGMFRKDKQAVSHWSPKLVEQCATRQKQILADVVDCLHPGGRLIYSTCTFNPKENEEVVQWLQAETGQFQVQKMPHASGYGLTEYIPGNYHAYPHKFKGEGFFLAALDKTGETHLSKKASASKSRQRNSPEEFALNRLPKRHQAKQSFLSLLPNTFSWEILQQKEHFYCLDKQYLESLLGLQRQLHIRKAGVRLGKENQFSHDLAMSGLVSNKFPAYEAEPETALRYLSRESLPKSPFQGWGLITHQNLPLGWVKAVSGRLNNHLPKALRIRTNLF